MVKLDRFIYPGEVVRVVHHSGLVSTGRWLNLNGQELRLESMTGAGMRIQSKYIKSITVIEETE